MNQKNKYEKLFWSIALPGFGQILNCKFAKGLLFIVLEFLVNVQSNFNQIILLSFHGEIESAIEQTNYQWLMFYPCLYFFVMWDAFKDAGGGKNPYSFLPFVFVAYWYNLFFKIHFIWDIIGAYLVTDPFCNTGIDLGISHQVTITEI